MVIVVDLLRAVPDSQHWRHLLRLILADLKQHHNHVEEAQNESSIFLGL